jgi:hypothetical protein
MSFKPERFQTFCIFSPQGSTRLISRDNATIADFAAGRTNFPSTTSNGMTRREAQSK